MKNRAGKKKRLEILRRLAGVCLALFLVVCALPVTARADSLELKVPVSVTGAGGGTVKIEGTDYVPRADGEQETFALGWNQKNGSSLMPSQSSLTVADGEHAEFVWDLDLSVLKAGDMYSYKISQVPGTDPKVVWDEQEYLLEIFIEYNELGTAKRTYVQLRQTEVDRDHKPAECAFKNLTMPTAVDSESRGPKGESQTGTPSFVEGSSPIVKKQLVDPYTGEPTDDTTVDALDEGGNKIGTYTLNGDGTVTFRPDPDFVGAAEPCGVVGTDENGLTATALYYPIVYDGPVPYDDHSRGPKGEPQSGHPYFEEGTDPIKKISLIDPNTGNPTDDTTVDALDEGGNKIGTYTLNGDGTITFRPDPDFVGDPKPCELQATDENNMSTTARYYPSVYEGPSPVDDRSRGPKGEPQTGHPGFEEGSTPITSVKLIDPETGEPTDETTVEARDGSGKKIGTYTLNEDGSVTFTPDPDFVGDPEPCEVEGTDENGMTTVTRYYPSVYEGPTPVDDETWGKRGVPQTGKPGFEEGSSKVTTVKLIDPETGEPTDKTTVNALDKSGKKIGTYTLNEDKTVTFTPDPSFVGDPQPCRVQGTDENGMTAVSVYTPHVTDSGRPPTGDLAQPLLYAAVLAVSGIAVIALLLVRRRKKDDEE
ncbi:MAG: hypothetical protein IJL66_07220 [Lachnospiraceae bacterium]|nr:hypothetical protein [Lachnospiraceae bacterium]